MLCLVSEKYQGKKNKMLRKIIFFIFGFTTKETYIF